jgi:hypothetical protein
MGMKHWEGRYTVPAGGVLVLAPSRRPWTCGIVLDYPGSYTLEISVTPTDAIDADTGAGGVWEELETGTASDMIPCDYAVTAIRVTLTGTSGAVELAS